MTCVRSSDTVSRQGGDEFVVLLSQVEHAEDAAVSARKCSRRWRCRTHRRATTLQITASIGVSIYPDDGQDAETLIKGADAAMYHAKENGRNNYQFFQADMNVRAVERQSLEGTLRGALERQRVRPALPAEGQSGDRSDYRRRGAAPLAASRSRARSSLQFVPIAEDCGLIVPIGQWVLREACRQARAWLDAGLRPVPMAVKFRRWSSGTRTFSKAFARSSEERGLDPRHLELELTESVLMQHVESTVAALQHSKPWGCSWRSMTSAPVIPA